MMDICIYLAHCLYIMVWYSLCRSYTFLVWLLFVFPHKWDVCILTCPMIGFGTLRILRLELAPVQFLTRFHLYLRSQKVADSRQHLNYLKADCLGPKPMIKASLVALLPRTISLSLPSNGTHIPHPVFQLLGL